MERNTELKSRISNLVDDLHWFWGSTNKRALKWRFCWFLGQWKHTKNEFSLRDSRVDVHEHTSLRHPVSSVKVDPLSHLFGSWKNPLHETPYCYIRKWPLVTTAPIDTFLICAMGCLLTCHRGFTPLSHQSVLESEEWWCLCSKQSVRFGTTSMRTGICFWRELVYVERITSWAEGSWAGLIETLNLKTFSLHPMSIVLC